MTPSIGESKRIMTEVTLTSVKSCKGTRSQFYGHLTNHLELSVCNLDNERLRSAPTNQWEAGQMSSLGSSSRQTHDSFTVADLHWQIINRFKCYNHVLSWDMEISSDYNTKLTAVCHQTWSVIRIPLLAFWYFASRNPSSCSELHPRACYHCQQ